MMQLNNDDIESEGFKPLKRVRFFDFLARGFGYSIQRIYANRLHELCIFKFKL